MFSPISLFYQNPESDDTGQTNCTNELSTEQIVAIERSATDLASTLPQFAPKMIQMKKSFGKELEVKIYY